MAQYTLEIRELTENNVDIFDFTYPIFDEAYRAVLEEKIINHFYFREIGVETTGRFIFNLKTRMNEIMPYYNKRYIAQSLEQRIMDNYDVIETMIDEKVNTGNSDSTTTLQNGGTTVNNQLTSDTPQGRVNLIEGNGQFVSGIREDTVTDDTNSDSTGSSTNNDTATTNWTRTMKGNIGIQTDANAVTQYMAAIVNVDLEIFKELNNLFMGVY